MSPFEQTMLEADALAQMGVAVYQVWTCGGCGQDVVADNPNRWTLLGHHEDCGFVTDLRKHGCGYVAFPRAEDRGHA